MKVKMSDKELRELDAWIAVNAMGWIDDIAEDGYYDGDVFVCDHRQWSPTRNKVDAFEVLKRCAEKLDCEDIKIGECCGSWSIQSVYRENPGAKGRINVFKLPPETLTLELAIALFARQLFRPNQMKGMR